MSDDRRKSYYEPDFFKIQKFFLEITSKPQTFLNTEQNELEEILQKQAFQIKPLRSSEKNIDFGDLNQAKVHLIKGF